jgi:hypothetical protein
MQIKIATENVSISIHDTMSKENPYFLTIRVTGVEKEVFALTNQKAIQQMVKELRAIANVIDHELREGRL